MTWQRRARRDMTLEEVRAELERKAARIGTPDEEYGDDYVLILFRWLPGANPAIPAGNERVAIQYVAGELCLITERDEWTNGSPTESNYRRHTQRLTEEVYTALLQRPQIIV